MDDVWLSIFTSMSLKKYQNQLAALGVNNFHQPVFVRKYETYVDALKYTKCLMKSNFIHTKPSVIFRNWKNQKCLPFYKVAKQATMH